MFSFHKPTSKKIDSFLQASCEAPFSYREVGATEGALPHWYRVDHNRVKLGEGEAVFRRAKEAIRRWDMYPELVELHHRPTTIQDGTVVAPLVRLCGVWAVAICRVVYVIDEVDEQTGTRQFGFSYGTLVGHPEQGEERFLVEMDHDGTVWYDLLAFSRPRHLLAWLAFPLVRRLQKQFGRQSKEAMVQAVQHAPPDS